MLRPACAHQTPPRLARLRGLFYALPRLFRQSQMAVFAQSDIRPYAVAQLCLCWLPAIQLDQPGPSKLE